MKKKVQWETDLWEKRYHQCIIFRGAVLIYFRNEERVIREKERQSRYIRHMRVMVANDMKTRERIDVQEREDRYKSSSL